MEDIYVICCFCFSWESDCLSGVIVMLKKLKTEADTYDFVRKVVLWLVLGAVVSGGYYRYFVKNYPAGSRGELVILVLSDLYLVLLFLPVLILAFTSAKVEEARRYPVLLRYKTRTQAQAARLVARVFFVPFMILSLVLMLEVAGRGLQDSGNRYPQAESASYVIACQCINIACYLIFILILREIFQVIFRNTALELFFTMLIPSVNWCVVQQDRIQLIRWTPWGNIVYTPEPQALSGLEILKETELSGYGFYWQYWLAVLAVSFVLAVLLERNRDYVFEQNRRSM